MEANIERIRNELMKVIAAGYSYDVTVSPPTIGISAGMLLA